MKKIILAAMYLFVSTQVHAWTLNADFENGTIGSKADGSDGFTGAFKYSKYTDVVAHTGNQSAELTINEGTEGFGEWGGAFKFPKPMYNGDEVWVRVWAYFPNGFSFNCGGCTQGVKFIRIHTATNSEANEGYHSILIKDAIEVDSEVTGKTFHSNNSEKKSAGEKVTTGSWHAYEMHIKFSSEPGDGIYRVWQDGKLVFEDTLTRTLKTSTSMSDFIYLFSYWNNGAPKTQSAYIDDIVITNVRPSKTDTQGNHFIGVSDHKLTPPPLPPVIN